MISDKCATSHIIYKGKGSCLGGQKQCNTDMLEFVTMEETW